MRHQVINPLKMALYKKAPTYGDLSRLSGYPLPVIYGVDLGQKTSQPAQQKIVIVLGMKIWSGPQTKTRLITIHCDYQYSFSARRDPSPNQ